MSTESSPARSTPISIAPLRFLWKRRSPLRFLEELGSQSRNIVVLRIGSQIIALVTHPDLVQQLLVTDAMRVEKGRTAERELFFAFLGDGLLNARGDVHRRQRRLMLPGFHRNRLAGYAQAMVETSSNRMVTWRDGEEFDVNAEMMALTLLIVGRTLFSSDVAAASHAITEGFDQLTENVNRMIFPGARWLLRTPLPFAKRLRAAQGKLDQAVYDLIAQRRERAVDTGDLLSMLLLAEDSEQPGERLSDVEVRDQIMTLLFTGQGPIGNTLSWIWWILAQHPEQEFALHTELATVLAGREPTLEDFPKLVITEQIVRETLRLYPSIWTMGRRAMEDLTYAGQTLPKGALLVASQWLTQRDERWFSEPLEFRPQRWTAEFRGTLPRYAYFPFGGGSRSCIGENFAWMELVLIVATIAQRWRFSLTPSAAEVKPHARITIHPDRPVQMRLHRRS